MGTRNLTMVIKDNKTKIAQYGQWDGYPNGQGLTVLNFLKEADMDQFKAQLDKCKFANKRTPTENLSLNYNSRDLGGDILNAVYYSKDKRILLVNKEEFIIDGLFCEWAYIIDLDSNVLQVYKGYYGGKLTKDDRFYNLQKRVDRKEKQQATEAKKEGRGHYIREENYHCELVGEFKLDELPSDEDFIKGIKKR